MQNVLLIHGYNGIPKIYEWLKKELNKKGYSVIVPEFPPQEGVKYDIWKTILNDYKKFINEETIIVAHSIGNEFIIKYLTENNLKVDLYIGLAGFADVFEHDGREELNRAVKEFLINRNEIDSFSKLTNKRFAIYSDNDHIVPFEVLEQYPKTINATPFLIKGIGHMGKKSGLETIPEVLEIIEL